MLDSTKTVLKLADIGMTCKELVAICTGYKDNDLEQFNYYHSMLGLLIPQYNFLISEAQITTDLQKEIWDKERVERESSSYYLEGKRLTYEAESIATESEKSTPVIEQIIYKPIIKQPFEKVIEFTLFGYYFFFVFELKKV